MECPAALQFFTALKWISDARKAFGCLTTVRSGRRDILTSMAGWLTEKI